MMDDHESKPQETDVYAIHGADPEVLAYAMAKYSRSSLSMRESLAEISSQRAEHFLNTFYFQYGHRSIADLAHIPFAIERLSLLAAIVLVDEQRWDGQERSTRYQDFRKSGWYTPQLGPETQPYNEAVKALFAAYEQVGAGMLTAFKRVTPRPDAMKPDAYERTLKARAFDAARYLLPLATNTSLGQIVNARTLETQVSRLLTSEFAEIRSLGERAPGSSDATSLEHGPRRVEEAGRGVRRRRQHSQSESGRTLAPARQHSSNPGQVRNRKRVSGKVTRSAKCRRRRVDEGRANRIRARR